VNGVAGNLLVLPLAGQLTENQTFRALRGVQLRMAGHRDFDSSRILALNPILVP
jgi:hypothetical protein